MKKINNTKKLTITVAVVSVLLAVHFIIWDFAERSTAEWGRNLNDFGLVKYCVPTDFEHAHVPAIDIKNSTHTFDLKNCTWNPHT